MSLTFGTYIGDDASPDLKRAAIAEMDAATPTVVRGTNLAAGTSVTVSLPHAEISGYLWFEGSNTLYIGTFDVDSGVKGNGAGTRILSKMCQIALDEGIRVVSADVISPRAMRIAGKLAGEQAVKIFDNVLGTQVELPISVDQAAQSIARAQTLEDAYEQVGTYKYVDCGFEVAVDVRSIADQLSS